MKHPLLPVLFVALLASGCAGTNETIASATARPSVTPSVTAIRAKAIRHAVFTWAVQNEVYRWMHEAHGVLRAHAAQLDQVFDFRALLIDGRITPPVITQADNTFRMLKSDLATRTITEYRIIAPSRIVTVPPNWRDYLLTPASKAHPLNSILRPRNRVERAIWRQSIREGRHWGVEQAKAVLAADFATLRRDYTGMVRARILMRQHVISTPVLARSSQGVRIRGNTLAVGAMILRITRHSDYNRSTEWKAIPASATSR
jgi:hypothetical protein